MMLGNYGNKNKKEGEKYENHFIFAVEIHPTQQNSNYTWSIT